MNGKDRPALFNIVSILLNELCHLRNIFSSTQFQVVDFGRSKIHMLKEKEAKKKEELLFHNLLNFGLAECLKHECIDSLFFSIMDLQSDMVLERYAFNFCFLPSKFCIIL